MPTTFFDATVEPLECSSRSRASTQGFVSVVRPNTRKDLSQSVHSRPSHLVSTLTLNACLGRSL